jgi:hypothetical protein
LLTSTLVVSLLVGPSGAVTAQEEEAVAPVEFTGTLKYVAKCTGTPAVEFGDGAIFTRAEETYCRPSVLEMSDPRFDGEWTLRENNDRYLGGPTVATSAFYVDTGEGTWAQQPSTWVVFGDGTAGTQTGVLTGDGAYDGLTAVVEFEFEPSEHWTLHGVVLGGALPPATEAAPATE